MKHFDDKLRDGIEDLLFTTRSPKRSGTPQQAERLFSEVMRKARRPKLISMPIFRYAVAATFLAVIAVSVVLLMNDTTTTPQVTERFQNDINPGTNGAILTLADGTKVLLDDLENGKVTDHAIKAGDAISYEGATKVEYNTMTTPNGRQYTVVLADGTQAWLNAGSSITFPTAFTGMERRVTVTGEVYFEVAPLAPKGGQKIPFRVEAGENEIEVLGTHFNVNAYDDEDEIKVTLAEGSVAVKSEKSKVKIVPGEQTIYNKTTAELTQRRADVEADLAWKEGKFIFTGNDIESVMRQLSRWYDVEVIYEGKKSKEEFVGVISRSVKVSEILKMLERTEAVRFKIEGRKIIVE